MLGPDRPQITIWRMRIACWITKATHTHTHTYTHTHTHSQYIILLLFHGNKGDLGVDWWIILRWISRRWDVGIWTVLGWPRIETVGGRL